MQVLLVCDSALRKQAWQASEKYSVPYRLIANTFDLEGISGLNVILAVSSSNYLEFVNQNPYSRFIVVGQDVGYGKNVKVVGSIEDAFQFLSNTIKAQDKRSPGDLPLSRATWSSRYKKYLCPICNEEIGANSINLRRHKQYCEKRSQGPVIAGRRKKDGPLVIKLDFPLKAGKHLYLPGFHILFNPGVIQTFLRKLKKFAIVKIEER